MPLCISQLSRPSQNTTDGVGGDLNNRHSFSHSSGGCRTKMKVPSGLLGGGALFLACIQLSSGWVLIWQREEASSRCPSLLQSTPVLLDQGLALRTLFNLNHFLKGPSSKRSPFGGERFSIWIFRENTTRSIPVSCTAADTEMTFNDCSTCNSNADLINRLFFFFFFFFFF